MNPNQRAAFNRLALALSQAQEALLDVVKESDDVIRSADDAYEASKKMADMLGEMSDDWQPEESSGLLCELYEAVERVQPELDRLKAAVEPKEESPPDILVFGAPVVNL